ncbi:MAG TPA: histidinol dehydrogenase, partial [Thermoanaerobaculia bacterium]|nr:histidinol dehydrogenase [Thermoanaerobaculia bacterium]
MLKVASVTSRAGRALLARLRARRLSPDFATLREALPIVESVLSDGAAALARFVADLDGERVLQKGLLVRPRAEMDVDPAFASAFRLARRRLTAYHRRQVPKGFSFRDALGVAFVERPVPHEAVGVYVPGGRAFYPSSLLMGVVPARVAGVKRIVVATPPRAFRQSRELRWALAELGVDEVLLAGGAHGIAGLVSVARCTKVVGPGNRWVAAAKHLVSGLVSIDMPAGPSEVLILASGGADPARIAADLLAQAEHDPDAVCLLFTDRHDLASATAAEVDRQLEGLSTAATARASLEVNGLALVFPSLPAAAKEGLSFAAEHVELMGRAAERFASRFTATSGAVFVGGDTPTAFGDYLAGPNHVLPTGGAARSFSGLSVRDFLRWGRSVSVPAAAARKLGPPAATLARFEGLEAHARSL